MGPKQLELPVTADTRWVYFFTSIVTAEKLKEVTPAGLAILMVLKTYADWKTSKTTIGQRRLMELTGIGKNTLIKTVDKLERMGYIKKEATSGNGRFVYTVYDIVQAEDRDGSPSKELQLMYQPKNMERQRAQIENMITNNDWRSTPGIQVFVVDNSTNTYNTYNTTNNFFGDITDVISAIAGIQLDSRTKERILSMAGRDVTKKRGDDNG